MTFQDCLRHSHRDTHSRRQVEVLSSIVITSGSHRPELSCCTSPSNVLSKYLPSSMSTRVMRGISRWEALSQITTVRTMGRSRSLLPCQCVLVRLPSQATMALTPIL